MCDKLPYSNPRIDKCLISIIQEINEEKQFKTLAFWNLWLGTSPEREYKTDVYHPYNWRKLLDYGCGTLGDMGVHIFDTPYTALELTVPKTVKTSCRKPNGFSHPEKNIVEYEFPKTKYTTDNFKWVWYDGEGAPEQYPDLKLADPTRVDRSVHRVHGQTP